jgi:hypothetical protein
MMPAQYRLRPPFGCITPITRDTKPPLIAK